MPDTRTAESIRTEMAHLRCELDDDVDEMVENVRALGDWRAYVRNYPWVCLGAVAAVGFLVVPNRVEIVSPSAHALEKLARHHKLVVKSDPEPEKKAGLAGVMFGLLANMAIRGATGMIGQHLGRYFDASGAGHGNGKAPQDILG